MKDEAIERTISGESWRGMSVAGWRWKTPVFKTWAYSYASHWSTGPADAERLFTQADVQALVGRLEGALNRVTIYQIEEDDRLHLSIGGVRIVSFRATSSEAMALLKFNAEQQALLVEGGG